MTTEKTLEGVREELTCAICQELFKVPKTLPCLHTFCEGCLRRAEETRKRMRPGDAGSANDVQCPSCRAVSEHEGNVDGLTKNFTFVNLIEHLDIHDKVSSEGQLSCGKCVKSNVEAPAVAFCYDCKAALCEACRQMHQLTREHSSHSLCSLNEIKQSHRLPPTTRAYMCPKHNDDQKLFCFDCQEVICRDCTVVKSDHRDHKFQFITQIIEDQKKEIRAKVAPLDATLKIVTGCCERLQAHLDRVSDVYDKRTQRVNSAIDDAIEILEQRRKHLLDESQKVYAVKRKNLDLELDDIDNTRASVASAIDFSKTTLENGSDVEVLMFKKEIVTRSKKLNEMRQTFESYEISEDDHTHFAYDHGPIRTFGKLCEAPFPASSVAEGPGLEIPLQSTETWFRVNAFNAKGRGLMSGGGACSVEVSCIPTVTQTLVTYPSTITDNNDGTYCVRYTPDYPGHTKVSVKFDGEPIQGSPFNPRVVRNYVHPIPSPMMFAIPNASPWSLAMVSDTEIAVTASDCLVHIYDIDGVEKDHVKSNFTRPYGISTDYENHLWITDREAHMVQKFRRDSNGEFVKLFQFGSRGIQAGQFSHPRGIAVNPATGYIYISDMKNNRIQIFKPDDPAPCYVGQFGAPGKGRGLFNLPAGMTFNLKGELIVCDDHNCRLQVFDPEGKFLYMIGANGTEKGLLCSPIGITMDFRGRLVITEFGSHSVTFLSPEGDILNSVRSIGPGFGQFVHPRGITSDSAGYVYVADNENTRVVRF